LDEKITREEPFKVVKSDPEKGKAMIAELVAEVYDLSFDLRPLMPATAEVIQRAIVAVKKPENLFPRLS
jgi:methionyl-tRNA synthetase